MRYLSEYVVPVAGARLSIPVCSKFIGVAKVQGGFSVVIAVGEESDPPVYRDVVISVFRKNEYMIENSKYIGFAAVGNDLFHLAYVSGEDYDASVNADRIDAGLEPLPTGTASC